jgi:hypothetical protein
LGWIKGILGDVKIRIVELIGEKSKLKVVGVAEEVLGRETPESIEGRVGHLRVSTHIVGRRCHCNFLLKNNY